MGLERERGGDFLMYFYTWERVEHDGARDVLVHTSNAGRNDLRNRGKRSCDSS